MTKLTESQDINALLAAVGSARSNYLKELLTLTEEQAHHKSAPEVWCAVEITEHLYWAEMGGIAGMWNVLNKHLNGESGYAGELIHRNLSIEEIVARTWQAKEVVPAVATPRMGGSMVFWASMLESLQPVLAKLVAELAKYDKEFVVHPHPISGPLDSWQRLEFLRFHIDRHRGQVNNLELN
jgi:DinB superfamily